MKTPNARWQRIVPRFYRKTGPHWELTVFGAPDPFAYVWAWKAYYHSGPYLRESGVTYGFTEAKRLAEQALTDGVNRG